MTHTVPSSCIPTPNSMDLGPLITLTADGAGTVNSTPQENFGCHGVTIGINVTGITGTTPSLTVKIFGIDGVSNQMYLILASAAITANGFVQLTVYPGMVAAANLVANSPLPSKWLVQTVVAGTGPSVTATIGASVIY